MNLRLPPKLLVTLPAKTKEAPSEMHKLIAKEESNLSEKALRAHCSSLRGEGGEGGTIRVH